MRLSALIRLVAIIFTLLATWFFTHTYFKKTGKAISLRDFLGSSSKITSEKHPRNKCDNRKKCLRDFFAFKITSGAANVVGPSICFEDKILMSAVKNNVGRGLNIALVDGTRGILKKHQYFDMFSGDIDTFLTFLKEIPESTLVLIASFDDPGSKLNPEARQLLTDLGSAHAQNISFRDSWVFLGAKGIKGKSPFEEFLKNKPEKNKYDGWPEAVKLEGCVPRKMV
ncbi:protein FAM3D [Sarcophilus harrisii]|uniref:FAM3 metabolism regulating signaling molecule D n=1 Tax=Sarcophilus harrisii TaxID=9305 RepID=G3VKA4_SARHA|nr:protein FAM3D [Sarcophilus harrisii]XP_023353851.1 protein FAM3D [Sarcophilus harrisii]